MKKFFVFVLLLGVAFVVVGRISLRLPVKAQEGPPVATENGDVNGDAARDIADAIHLINWLFEGGPPPVALAQDDGAECDLTSEECDQLKGMLTHLPMSGVYFNQFESTDDPPTFPSGVILLDFHPDGTFSSSGRSGADTAAHHFGEEFFREPSRSRPDIDRRPDRGLRQPAG